MIRLRERIWVWPASNRYGVFLGRGVKSQGFPESGRLQFGRQFSYCSLFFHISRLKCFGRSRALLILFLARRLRSRLRFVMLASLDREDRRKD